jgi:hypothetical protein
MSLEFFEPRPPKIVALKLDFLDDPDSEVAEKLRTMPIVSEVAIEYGIFGRTVAINPHGRSDSRWVFRTGLKDVEDAWLVYTPPPPDSEIYGPGELKRLSDSEFHRRYRPCESESISA